MGLHEKYRGQGLGKKLLETSIEMLKRKCIKKISLIVIGKNKVAYNMYQKRGFKVYRKISDCVVINKI
ncbi:MAG: GNAT family N-acetyltransferase [Clostridiaceae bacterium]|nr:GNAT family N-acetyltransferase [Clostridiaceae bacterium]